MTRTSAHRMNPAAWLLLVVVTIAIAGCQSPRTAAPANMVWIPGGTLWMGCEGCGMADALPVHRVSVDGFWMDRTPVTNAEFERFVNATGYLTVAEHQLDPKDFPGVPRDKLVPGSAVFHATSHPVPLDNALQWWQYTAGASWRHPEGPGSSVQDRSDHPVVHIAFEEANSGQTVVLNLRYMILYPFIRDSPDEPKPASRSLVSPFPLRQLSNRHCCTCKANVAARVRSSRNASPDERLN